MSNMINYCKVNKDISKIQKENGLDFEFVVRNTVFECLQNQYRTRLFCKLC